MIPAFRCHFGGSEKQEKSKGQWFTLYGHWDYPPSKSVGYSKMHSGTADTDS